MFRQIKVLNIFYKRNAAKNILLVFFLNITNLFLVLFVLVYSEGSKIITVFSESYFEHLSVDVSLYQSVETNNELINVKSYERPSLSYLQAYSTHTGQFNIRPDYSYFWQNSEVSLFGKTVDTPQIITYLEPRQGIGINGAYLKILKENSSVDEDDINIKLVINASFIVNEKVIEVNLSENLHVNFIFDEPNYFSTPKLYLPQGVVDQSLGSLMISPGLTLNNFLLNVNASNELLSQKLRCHFKSSDQLSAFIKISEDVKGDDQGLEISGDHISKVESFKALYEYLNILIIMLLVFVVIASLVIYFVVAYTSLISILPQAALLKVLGAKKIEIYFIFLAITIFNFLLGIGGVILIPDILQLISRLIHYILNLNLIFTLNYNLVILIIGANFLLLLITITIIFLVNMRRPLLYLLIDA